MKKSRIVLCLAGGLLVVALIFIALLPAIVSSDMMKPFVIKQVNQQFPGQLQLESWSLSWFGGIEGQGLVYDNQTDGLLAQVSEIRTEKGLWGLMVAGGELGLVEIVDPAMVFFLADKTNAQGSQKTPSPTPTPDSIPAEKDDAFIPVYYGNFNITNGSILTAATDGNKTVVAKKLNLLLNAPGPETPITYRFSVESGDSSGRASGEGSLALAADDPLNIQKIQSDSKLSIKNWELENIFAIIATQADIPTAKGRLNADVSLTGSSAQSLKMAGQVAMKTLKLRGGPLGTDAPTVQDIVIDLDGLRTNNTLSINKLIFRSSLANGSASGIINDENQKRLSGKADVDLAEVFAQFPATLKLREGTKITKGKMALSANIETARTGTAFDGDARIDRLQGISAGKKISWTKPVTVSARGEIHQEGLQLENLALRSSFLKADGRGDMRNMRVDLAADLKAALAELRKFIVIKQWDGSGKLKLNINLKEKKEGLNHATLKLKIDDFMLSRNRRPILARQVVQADFNADVQLAEVAANSKLLQPSLKIQSSVATGTVTAQQVAGSASNSFPNAKDFKLDGNINLQQLSSLLKTLDLLSPKTLLAGQSKIKTSGALNDGLLTLDNARIDTQKLIYRQDNKIIRENRVLLTTRGQIDLNDHSLLLAPVDIDGQAGKIHIPKLAIADWADAQKKMKINGQADLDLNKLARSYGDFIQLPEKTQLSGNGHFAFDMDFTHPKTQFLKLQGTLAPFKLVSKTLPAISEKKVTLLADVNRSPDGRDMTINNFELNSNALSLNAAGTLNRVGKNKVLDAKGTMQPDMKLVSEYLKKSGQSQVTFSGKKATPFTIKLVSKGDRWEDPLKHLNFSGAVHVTAIEAYGLKLTPKDVPIRIAAAAAGAKLESPANGGQLDFQPTIDMRKDPYILSFKENIDLLKDVQVTQGLIDGLLAAIHPLFKDSVVPDGLLSLNMKHFSWPLSEKYRNRATFAGTLTLNGVRLNSTPFMAGLLNMMGISERELSLVDQDIAFEAKDGRIALSPMTLEAEGHQLKMHGTVGFDNTLDFIARIPVTEKMVGKDAYQFLQGTSIKVPIRGTASKPRIDETAFQQAIGDLMQQFLRKNLEKGAQDLLKNLFKK
jgi:translocation and assembly module TamB